MLKALRLRTLMIAVVLIAAFGLSSSAQEKKVSKKDVPAAVLSSFAKAYPEAKIRGYAKEVEEGKTYYEVESMNGKQSLDALYLADGSVAEVEEGVMPADLPAAVRDAVHDKYPKGKITKAEKTTRGQEMTYELRVVSGKSKVEMVVDTSGKILKESASGGMKESKEEKEEKED